MNAHDRRKHRRWLEREWPYYKVWPLRFYLGNEDEAEKNRLDFHIWMKEQGLTREIFWQKVPGQIDGLYPRYYVRFRKEENYMKYILTWDTKESE